jgi:hypothetical protein
MTIGIYIDNCVWNFLYDRQLDLAVELPREEFVVCITRHAEFEIPPIERTKPELSAFIAATIDKCLIKTDTIFGFNDDTLPSDEQRVGGFDNARWVSTEEIEFLERLRAIQNSPLYPNATTTPSALKKMKTGLYKNEADIALAMVSVHSVVLTLDTKQTGPLNKAYQIGGKVVYLTEFDQSGMALAGFIKSKLS